tara:strand:+ start:14562 stop:15158 length:597 start_codon:yes stop_codon:yes gene_type:complete
LPTLIDDTKEFEVSNTQYKDLRKQVENGNRDRVITSVEDDAQNKVRLWDVIGKNWTEPFSRNSANDLYLKKVIIRCSECTFTSSFDGDVARHAKSVREEGEKHANAVDKESTCTGCNLTFTGRSNSTQKHIANIKDAYEKHQGIIEEQLIYQFSLQESLPNYLRKEQVARAISGVVERSVTPSKRKRSRSRHKRRRTA